MFHPSGGYPPQVPMFGVSNSVLISALC
jgi:hypothetical protein